MGGGGVLWERISRFFQKSQPRLTGGAHYLSMLIFAKNWLKHRKRIRGHSIQDLITSHATGSRSTSDHRERNLWGLTSVREKEVGPQKPGNH